MQMILKFCRNLQYIRKIILVTDGRGSMDADDVKHITTKCLEDKIELIILYADHFRSIKETRLT